MAPSGRRIWRCAKTESTGEVSGAAPANAGTKLNLFRTPGDSLVVDLLWGESKPVSVLLVDKNLNPLASHSSGSDRVEISIDNTNAEVTPSTLPLTRDSAGVTFDPNTGAISGGPENRTAYIGIFLASEYTFNIRNTLSAGETVPETWAIIDVDVTRTPAPGVTRSSTNLPIPGTTGGDLDVQ